MNELFSIADACSCGESGDHVIMRRRSADGFHVLVWHSGAITDWSGFYIARTGRAKWSANLYRAVNQLIHDEFCLVDFAEMSDFVRAARELAKKPGWLFATQRADFIRNAWVDFEKGKKP